MKFKQKLDKNKVFFTADTHFSHTNIIKYTNRPFKDANEMNNALIRKWNNAVPKDGVVFHLGDVGLNNSEAQFKMIMDGLNGEIHLITGNHEKDAMNYKGRFASINDIVELEIEDDEITYGKQHLVMCHYPMIAWNGSHRGSWQLFGHVHGGLSNKGVVQHKPTQLDVGVDCWQFTPFSYQEVKEQITKQCMK